MKALVTPRPEQFVLSFASLLFQVVGLDLRLPAMHWPVGVRLKPTWLGRRFLSSLIPLQRSLVEQGIYCTIEGSIASLPATSHASLRVLICKH